MPLLQFLKSLPGKRSIARSRPGHPSRKKFKSSHTLVRFFGKNWNRIPIARLLLVSMVATLLISFWQTVGAQTSFSSDSIPDRVKEIAPAITVALKQKSSDGSDLYKRGTGVIIGQGTNNYLVLTAAHNLDSNKDDKLDGNDTIIGDYQIVTRDRQKHEVTEYIRFKTQELGKLDLAILYFTAKKSYPTANFVDVRGDLVVNSVQLGEYIYVAGFPQTAEDLTIDRGKIEEKYSPDREDGYPSPRPESLPFTGGYSLDYKPDNLEGIAPGMSGGPILTEKGYLIGIHGRENYFCAEVSGREDYSDKEECLKRGIGLDVAWDQILEVFKQAEIRGFPDRGTIIGIDS